MMARVEGTGPGEDSSAYKHGMRAKEWEETTKSIRLRTHNQNMTVAASAMAERNTLGHRSYRVAARRQSLRLPNILSIRLRRL